MAKKKTQRSQSSRPQKGAKGSPAASRPRRWARFEPSQWILGLLFLSIPLIFIPGLTENFRAPKLFAAELMAVASLALLCLRARNSVLPSPAEWPRLPMVKALAPLTAMVLLSAALSSHDEVVARGLPSFLIGAATLLGWNLGLTAVERRRLLRLLVWPAGLLSVLAILQFHGLFEPFAFKGRVTERVGLTSLAGGVFDLAGFLFLPAWVGFIWWPKTKGPWRIALGLMLATIVYALLISRTLTVLVSVGVSVLVYVAYRGVGEKMGRRLAATTLAGALVFGLLATVGPLAPRLSSKINDLRQGELNRLLSGRLDGWYGAMEMFREHPVTGVGPAAFRAEFGLAKLRLSAEGVEFFRGQHQVFFVNAHSDYLEALSEWGLLGAGALIWAIWVLFSSRARRRENEGHTDDLRRVELPIMAGMAVISVANFPFHVGLIAYPWLLFISGLAPSSPPREAGGQDKEADQVRKKSALPLILLGLLLLAYLPPRFVQVKNRLGADRLVAMVEAQTRQVLAQGGRAPGQLMQLNIDLLKRAQEMDPASISAKVGLASQYMFMKRYPAAIRELNAAAELEPRAEVYANLAQCYLATGNKDAAFEAIQTAIQLDHTQRKKFSSLIQKENRLKKWREKQKGNTE